MDSKVYVKKGVYTKTIVVRIKNLTTGKTKAAYSYDGFVTFYNLEPGEYVITKWRLYGKSGKRKFQFFGPVLPEITFKIKPQTVTMINKIRVNFKIGGKYRWIGERMDLDTKKIEMEKAFNENPKNTPWQNYKFEFKSYKNRKR